MKNLLNKISCLIAICFLLCIPKILTAQCNTGDVAYTYCYGNQLTNEVAFEICPDVGTTASATIAQGSFDTFLPDVLTVYQGASGSGTTGTVVFGPSTGNLAGMSVNGTVAGQCLIFVVTSDFFLSCGDGFELELIVCTDIVTFSAPSDLCINAGVQTGLGGGAPTGGIYSGPGVTDGGNGMTYSFDPVAAGAGTHSLTYAVGGLSNSDNITVTALPGAAFTAPADLCVDAGVQTGLGGGTPTGGVYSGTGVTDNGNGTTYTFDPAAAGEGTHTITYTEGSICQETATDNITVLAACGCAENLVLSSAHVSGDITFEASQNITSTEIISGTANVSYSAGNSIELNPEFTVDLGAQFHAFILGCGVTRPDIKK